MADFPLRVLVYPVHLGVDFSAISADQPRDYEILALKTTGIGLKFEDAVVQNDGPMLLCDISMGRTRPIMPVTWHHRVFGVDHSLLHLVQVSMKLVGSKFVSWSP